MIHPGTVRWSTPFGGAELLNELNDIDFTNPSETKDWEIWSLTFRVWSPRQTFEFVRVKRVISVAFTGWIWTIEDENVGWVVVISWANGSQYNASSVNVWESWMTISASIPNWEYEVTII